MLSTYTIHRLRSPWGELPIVPPVAVTPKEHKLLIPWYTSGFK